MQINPFSLSNKTIVVTGGSSGIGRQVAITCSQLGARVVLLGRDETRLNETLQSLLHLDKQHLCYSVDLLNYSLMDDVVKQLIAQVGKVDGLVHCAGISTTLPLKLISPDKLIHFFETNVNGAISLTKLLTKQSYIPQAGLSVVFLSSVMGFVGESGKTLYSLTKGALLAGSRSLAVELAKYRVRVNCISPGVVVTPMSKNAVYSQDEDSLNRITNLHPMGLGEPEDVANACVYLLSEAAKWVTGTNLVVDGGYTAR